MRILARNVGYWVMETMVLTALWYVIYVANAAIFEGLALNDHANLIFLPAALRVIFPMVFGGSGICGLIVGSYLAFPHDNDASTIHDIVLAVLSGTTTLPGIALFRCFFNVRTDLANLRPHHLVALALLCGLANALILNLYLHLSEGVLQPIRQVATIFVGDLVGTLVMLYLTAITLSFLMSRKRRSS